VLCIVVCGDFENWKIVALGNQWEGYAKTVSETGRDDRGRLFASSFSSRLATLTQEPRQRGLSPEPIALDAICKGDISSLV
jgi:hypothetical protein